jgi:hypothetical protein
LDGSPFLAGRAGGRTYTYGLRNKQFRGTDSETNNFVATTYNFPYHVYEPKEIPLTSGFDKPSPNSSIPSSSSASAGTSWWRAGWCSACSASTPTPCTPCARRPSSTTSGPRPRPRSGAHIPSPLPTWVFRASTGVPGVGVARNSCPHVL